MSTWSSSPCVESAVLPTITISPPSPPAVTQTTSAAPSIAFNPVTAAFLAWLFAETPLPPIPQLIPPSHSPQSVPCARTYYDAVNNRNINCTRQATGICGGCRLVAYCGDECQAAHRLAGHINICNSDIGKDDWLPAAALAGLGRDEAEAYVEGGSLWGEFHGFDVIRLETNERPNWDEDLAVCFAASGDLRSVVQSVNGLPDSYNGALTGVINDASPAVAARNLLLLLVSVLLDPLDAARLMLHLWYSAKFTHAMAAFVNFEIRPFVQKVVDDSEGRDDEAMVVKTWSFDEYRVMAYFPRSTWLFLLDMLRSNRSLAETEPRRQTKMLHPGPQRDWLERRLYKLPRHTRLSYLNFLRNGVLLPLSCQQTAYRYPNPILYHPHTGAFLPHHTSDPMRGWDTAQVFLTGHQLSNPISDIYGSLYFHIFRSLLKFCRKLSSAPITLQLYNTPPETLPATLHDTLPYILFDRIDTSNLAETTNLTLPTTLKLYTPLLDHLNPYSTLLTFFLNYPPPTLQALGSEFIPPPPDEFPGRTIHDRILEQWHHLVFRDYNELFEHYKLMHDEEFETVPRRLGIRRRSENRLVPEWPLRVRQHSSEEMLNATFGVGFGAETVVEWEFVSKEEDGEMGRVIEAEEVKSEQKKGKQKDPNQEAIAQKDPDPKGPAQNEHQASKNRPQSFYRREIGG